jgi:MFS family permease
MLVLGIVPNIVFAVAVATVVGAGSVAFMTAATSLAQIRSDQEMIGRVLAIQTVLIIGTTPIGGPILGAISDAIGARWPVLIGGVAALAAALFGLVAARRSEAHQGAS